MNCQPTDETELIELSIDESMDLARQEIDAEIASFIGAGKVYESTFYKIDATRAGIFVCFSSTKLCQDLLEAENSFFVENYLRVSFEVYFLLNLFAQRRLPSGEYRARYAGKYASNKHDIDDFEYKVRVCKQRLDRMGCDHFRII